MATFDTEVLKLFAPYQRGALNIVTQQTRDWFPPVQPVLWRFKLPRHGVVKLQQVRGDVFEAVDVQLFVLCVCSSFEIVQ